MTEIYYYCIWNILLKVTLELCKLRIRAVPYDNIYRMDEIKSPSRHIMFYCLFRGVAKYIVYGNTFFIIWVTDLYTPPTTEREAETERPARS